MSLLTTSKISPTEQRIKNMRALVAELANREMMAGDIADFLSYGSSGTRKYINDLRAAGVMEIARYVDGTDRQLGTAVYCIVDDPERLAAFDELLEAPPQKRVGVGAPSMLTKAQRDPSRRIHIMHDDMPVQLRMHRDMPIRHTELMAAFFGLPGGAA